MAKQLLSVPDGDHLTFLHVFNEYQNSTYRFNLCLLQLTRILSDLRDRNWARDNYISARSLAEATNVRAQLLRIMERLGIGLVTKPYEDLVQHYMDIPKALVCGYYMQVAHKEGERDSYLTIKDNQVRRTHKCKCEYHSSDPTFNSYFWFRWYHYILPAV